MNTTTNKSNATNPTITNNTEPRKSDAAPWKEGTFASLEDITRADLLDMLHGHSAGIRVRNVLSTNECAEVVTRVRKMATRSRQYEGGLNIGTPLNIPSHWEFKYTKLREDAWFTYFRSVAAATRRRHVLFEGIQDPLEAVLRAFSKAWGSPVRHVRHPKFGWKLYAGMIRSGAPRLHFDWAPYDLDLKEVVMQAGANVYLSNFEQGGDLKVYRKYGMSPGKKASDGEKVIGNYGLPHDLVENAESCTIECGVGDLVVAPNRFLHEVTPGNEPEANRLVLSFHVALLSNGKLVVFS